MRSLFFQIVNQLGQSLMGGFISRAPDSRRDCSNRRSSPSLRVGLVIMEMFPVYRTGQGRKGSNLFR
jgi:hypothetical protein